jgi:murein DD-endopeptidase MepM/ murein hydrolase activator NlpD
MKKPVVYLGAFGLLMILLIVGCSQASPGSADEPIAGCDGQIYPDPAESPYVLPFPAGEKYETGLTNCSSSYHRAGEPDQYAFDFDMPVGTEFTAVRSGTVYRVVEDQPSNGGGAGNYVVIDHGDGTYALYYHSPQDGIDVTEGDAVDQGEVLGISGRSGLAGYPHLHFIVVDGEPTYPYHGLAITFRNALPADVVLKSYAEYEAAVP